MSDVHGMHGVSGVMNNFSFEYLSVTNIYLFINQVENFVAGKISSHQRANCSNID
jgi:hypothetical protein